MEVLDLMKDIGVTPSNVVFTCLIKQAISVYNINMAIRAYNRMKRENISCDYNCYNILLNGLIDNG